MWRSVRNPQQVLWEYFTWSIILNSYLAQSIKKRLKLSHTWQQIRVWISPCYVYNQYSVVHANTNCLLKKQSVSCDPIGRLTSWKAARKECSSKFWTALSGWWSFHLSALCTWWDRWSLDQRQNMQLLKPKCMTQIELSMLKAEMCNTLSIFSDVALSTRILLDKQDHVHSFLTATPICPLLGSLEIRMTSWNQCWMMLLIAGCSSTPHWWHLLPPCTLQMSCRADTTVSRKSSPSVASRLVQQSAIKMLICTVEISAESMCKDTYIHHRIAVGREWLSEVNVTMSQIS